MWHALSKQQYVGNSHHSLRDKDMDINTMITTYNTAVQASHQLLIWSLLLRTTFGLGTPVFPRICSNLHCGTPTFSKRCLWDSYFQNPSETDATSEILGNECHGSLEKFSTSLMRGDEIV